MGNEIQRVNNGLERTRSLLSNIGQDKSNPSPVSRSQRSERPWSREIPEIRNSEVGFSSPSVDFHRRRFETSTDLGLQLSLIRKSKDVPFKLRGYEQLVKQYGHRMFAEAEDSGFPSPRFGHEINSLAKITAAFNEDFPGRSIADLVA